MEFELTGNGTFPIHLPPGKYRYEISGTLGGSTAVALKAGPSADGSDHVACTYDGTPTGTAISHASGAVPEPQVIQGGGYISLVVSSYSGSSDLLAIFRYLGEA